MDRIALGFAGTGLLHAGQLLVRALTSFLPKRLEYREPPLWSLGLFALGGVAWQLLG